MYLAFDKREAVAGGWGSGRTRAFWWSGFWLSRGGRSFPVERVLLTDPLNRRKIYSWNRMCDVYALYCFIWRWTYYLIVWLDGTWGQWAGVHLGSWWRVSSPFGPQAATGLWGGWSWGGIWWYGSRVGALGGMRQMLWRGRRRRRVARWTDGRLRDTLGEGGLLVPACSATRLGLGGAVVWTGRQTLCTESWRGRARAGLRVRRYWRKEGLVKTNKSRNETGIKEVGTDWSGGWRKEQKTTMNIYIQNSTLFILHSHCSS